MSTRLTPMLWISILSVASCTGGLNGFQCNDDPSCGGGTCVDHGCAVTDAACPTGYRWDETTGPRAGVCAVLPDLPLSLDAFIDPRCGNGKIDPGELCDDGAGSPQPCPTPATCNAFEACISDQIIGGACHRECIHIFIADATKCPTPDGGVGGDGVCYKHTCCRGCWDGNTCLNGQAPASCGSVGMACAPCSSDECNSKYCSMVGGCQSNPVADNTQCPVAGGICIGGSCCTGCLVNKVCQPGNVATACGSGGNGCADCTLSGAPCNKVNGNHRCAGAPRIA